MMRRPALYTETTGDIRDWSGKRRCLKRQRLLKQKLTEEELKDWKERNLSDTQYITRAVYNLLNDHLHHAMDAAVVAVTTDWMIERIFRL